MKRDELVKVIRKPYETQEPGIKLIRLTETPVGAISVVLEGLDRNGEVVAFSVQGLVLTSDPVTVTFTPPIPEVEFNDDLSFGFRYVQLMFPAKVQTDHGLEDHIVHLGYLYYCDQRLCQLFFSSFCSVSPSGNHVIFQAQDPVISSSIVVPTGGGHN